MLSATALGWLAASFVAIGVVPLVRVGVLSATGARVERATWLMAGAFGVSFLADVTDLLAGPGLASQVYLVSQAALFAYVLAGLRRTVWFVALLAVCAGVSITLREGQGPDVLVHAVAYYGVAWCAFDRVQPVARVLALGFAGLAGAWLCYVYAPGLVTLCAYQGVRLALAVGWCYVVARADT